MNNTGTVREPVRTSARGRLRPLVAAAAVALTPLAVAAPAHAATPAGSCPPPYTLIAISAIPAPGQPGAIALDQRGNNDGYVCVMPYPNPDGPGAPYNGIDNRVPSH